MVKIEYAITEAYSAVDLQNQVNINIQDGWEPIGGVAVMTNTDPTFEDYNFTWAQALIRRTEEPSEKKAVKSW